MKKTAFNAGSTLDSLLKEEGIYEEVQQLAIKKAIAFEIDGLMRASHITKADMARKLSTSRSQLDRVLDPNNDAVTLKTLGRAAALVGKRLHLSLEHA